MCIVIYSVAISPYPVASILSVTVVLLFEQQSTAYRILLAEIDLQELLKNFQLSDTCRVNSQVALS